MECRHSLKYTPPARVRLRGLHDFRRCDNGICPNMHIGRHVKPELLDLPVVASRGETLRVLEPPSADRGELLEAILRRRYGKPFIGESAQERTLYFSLDNIQSRMRLDDPWALDLSYTRKVMSFLLFRAAPRRILMVGLGGGSLAKYCYRYLPLA